MSTLPIPRFTLKCSLLNAQAFGEYFHLGAAMCIDPEFQGYHVHVRQTAAYYTDIETIARSVRKTHRAVIVEEGHRFAGVGAEIADQIYGACFDDLDAPIVRVTHTENPLPYARNLEAASLPSPAQVIRACKAVMYRT